MANNAKIFLLAPALKRDTTTAHKAKNKAHRLNCNV